MNNTKMKSYKSPAYPRKRHKRDEYLNNQKMVEEVIKSKVIKKMTPDLTKMMVMLTNRISEKGLFSKYTYLEDMKSVALVNLAKSWDKFNIETGTNAFAYYTQCIKTTFYQYLNYEKNQRNIKDKLLTIHGKDPSFTYRDSEDDEYQSEEIDLFDNEFKEPSLAEKDSITNEYIPYKLDETTEFLQNDEIYSTYKISQGENIITGTIKGTLLDCIKYASDIVEKANIRQLDQNWMRRRW